MPVVRVLERAGVDELTDDLAGADAVVFAAGAGPASGAARKDTVDRAATVPARRRGDRGGRA
ncbi:MAG: hypothetical protein ACRYF3_05095 [Janthinobacterium lividum]